jgi:hypothetical protein
LLEVGPRFQPDLVVVGFYENDLVDDTLLKEPGALARLGSALLSLAQRHVYSLELYKKIYLQIAWRVTSSSNEYRRRLENLGSEDQLVSRRQDVTKLKEQELTSYERLTEDQMGRVKCIEGEKASPTLIDAMQREPGYGAWLAAVRRFQELHLNGAYKILFFLNVVPRTCPYGNVFYDSTRVMNEFYLRIMSSGTPAVSCHDAFLRLRPSQMPAADSHSIGNSNAVKADVLFTYLRDHVLSDAVAQALRTRGPS